MTTALFFTSLRRYWYVVLAGLLIGAVLGIGVGALLPRKYEATSLLLLSAPKISQPSDASSYVESRMPTYGALVTTRPVLDRAGESLGLKDPSTITDKQVSAQVEESTLLITLTATASTPQGAASLAQAVAKSFASLAPKLDNSQRPVLNVDIVEKAVPPLKPAGLSTALLGLMGCILGLTGGLVVALARQAFPSRGSNVQEKVHAVSPLAALGPADQEYGGSPASTGGSPTRPDRG